MLYDWIDEVLCLEILNFEMKLKHMETWDKVWGNRNTPPMEDSWCEMLQYITCAHSHELVQKHFSLN